MVVLPDVTAATTALGSLPSPFRSTCGVELPRGFRRILQRAHHEPIHANYLYWHSILDLIG